MSVDRQEVSDRLHSAALHLVRTVRSADAAMGLTPARASVLSVLVFGGARTIGGLARGEGVRSPTMSLLVNGLERDGLAHRVPGGQDARQVLVRATPKARRLLQEGRQRRVRLLRELLADLGDEDLVVLDRAATLVEAAVADHPGPATGEQQNSR
jgi:DNA-binding MarR family transcriptional regulator